MRRNGKLCAAKRVRWERFSDDLWIADLPDGTRASVQRHGKSWTVYLAGRPIMRGLTVREAKRIAEAGEQERRSA